MNLRRLALLAIIVLAPITSALVGHRFGYSDGSADEYGRLSSNSTATFATWTDQEVHSLTGGSGLFVSVSCVEHRSDGTIHITEKVMRIVDAAGKRLCS